MEIKRGKNKYLQKNNRSLYTRVGNNSKERTGKESIQNIEKDHLYLWLFGI